MFCKKCGANIPDDEDICPYCEEPVDGRSKKTEQKEESSNENFVPEVKTEERKEKEYRDYSFSNIPKEEPVDSGSIGFAILSFFIPIVGLILFCVWRKEKPVSSKQCGIAALISFILEIIFYGALICCIISMGDSIGRV